MMNVELIEKLEKIVEDTCKKDTNIFGYEIWVYHIKPVIKQAQVLAEKLDANLEIVTIAAILHDYASVLDKNLYEEHHIHGARLAEDLLKTFNYDYKKIELVKACIFSHRGSKNIERLSKEEICLASADAMAHIDQIPSLFHLVFVKQNMQIDDGSEFVLGKLERSYNKLCNEAKELIADKYNAAKILLNEYKKVEEKNE